MTRVRGAVVQAQRRGLRGMGAQTRANLTALIATYVSVGKSDPVIGDILGIKTTAVTALRKAAGIRAGEQRWRGGTQSLNTLIQPVAAAGLVDGAP